MKYIIAFTGCIFLFAQCKPKIDVQPTGSYDTLGVRWMTIERNNITYYFQGTGVKGASIYTDMYEEAYEKTAPVFNATLPRKLRFFVWTDWVLAERLLGHPLSFAVGQQCVCHVKINQSPGHEMTHILSYWAGGTPRVTYSRLVTEGVAVAFDLSGDDRIEKAKSAMEGQNIKSVADLWSRNYDSAPEEVFYPIAGAFIDYLYKQNLVAEFNALLKNQTLEEAEIIYGKERLHALIANFDNQVGL